MLHSSLLLFGCDVSLSLPKLCVVLKSSSPAGGTFGKNKVKRIGEVQHCMNLLMSLEQNKPLGGKA